MGFLNVVLAAFVAKIVILVFLNSPGVLAGNEKYTEQMSSDLEFISECNKTSPIGLAAMNAVLVHQKITGIGDENFKCFLHCLYTKYNWMDKEGSFLLGSIRESLRNSELPPSAAQWLLYRCTSTTESEPCDRALDFTQCFWSEAKQAPQHDDVFDFDMAFKQRLFNSKRRIQM